MPIPLRGRKLRSLKLARFTAWRFPKTTFCLTGMPRFPSNLVDRWLLSRLNTLIREVDQGLRFFDMFAAGRKLNDFVDDLSNWYVRRNRQRYWQPGMEADKINAYMTLFTALNTVIHLAAPFVPFITEAIYQNLVGSVCPDAAPSIHLNP